MLAHFAVVFTLGISYLLSTELGETFLKDRLILFLFSQQRANPVTILESLKPNPVESSVETVRFLFCIMRLFIWTKKRVISLHLFIYLLLSCVQQSSWETSLLWPLWRPSCQPWHRTLTLHLTTFALSKTSRQARTEGLPLYSYLLLWYGVIWYVCVYININDFKN